MSSEYDPIKRVSYLRSLEEGICSCCGHPGHVLRITTLISYFGINKYGVEMPAEALWAVDYCKDCVLEVFNGTENKDMMFS